MTNYERPSNLQTWQDYHNLIVDQIADMGRTIATLTGQRDAVGSKRKSAQDLLDLLPDTRVNKQERERLIRFLSSTSQSEGLITTQIERVEKRLATWKHQQTHFNTFELRKEKKLAQARANVGKLSGRASGVERFLIETPADSPFQQ
jgi:hypothetical protein